jgi:O-antigen ligase
LRFIIDFYKGIKTMKLSAPFQNRTKLYLNLLALSLLFLPFRHNISSVFGIILFLFFFVDKENTVKEKCKRLLKNKVAILTLSIYLLHLIGLIYTQNFKYASLDLEIKLPLFIIPFVIFSERKLTSENLNYVFKFYTIGNLAALFFCIVFALVRLYLTKSQTVLFYNELSRFMHPSYFSLYIGFNCVFIFNKIAQLNPQDIKYKSQLFQNLAIVSFFVIGILILSSKAGILISGITLIFFAIKELFYKKLILTFFLSSIFIVLFGIISIFKNDILALSRFEDAQKELSSKTNAISETTGSSSSRLLIWQSSKSVLIKNLAFGVGTGDIKDELIKQYKKVNFLHGVENQNNCHNQYLQFFILFGIIGGLLFLVSLVYPIYISIKNNNTIYLYFIFLIAVNMLVESMLESKAGVEFFALFNAILLNYIPRTQK